MDGSSSGNVLLVDDDRDVRELVCDALTRQGHRVTACVSGESALECLGHGEIEVVVTDLYLQGLDGLGLCQLVQESWPGTPVVVITGSNNVDSAVGALRAGAYDFVVKPLDIGALERVVDRALRHVRLDREVRRLRREVAAHEGPRNLVGSSPPMRALLRRLQKALESDASVLITGESGTGKELVARALHESGNRRTGPFVVVDCASIPSSVLESELFGHVKGAFTDARTDRRGLFVEANGGTLFLDEIGELPLELQAKLLRALQQRHVRPVGSNDLVPYDARLVAATNRDLDGEAAEGRFRRDLYYRLNVVQLEMPPLRVRGNDVLVLAQHFLGQAAKRSGKRVDGFVRAAAEKLLAYDWPGNVRELENCVESAVALAEHDRITVDDLPERVRSHHPTQLIVGSDAQDLVSLEELEKRYVRRVLAAVGGNKTQAAKILGVERRTLYRKLERFEN